MTTTGEERIIEGVLRSLRVYNFRLFAAGQVLSVTGTWMMFTAQDWLVLSLSGDSGTALGLVTALQFTPMLLLTLYGGRLADRHDKRLLLTGANLVAGLLALTLALLVFAGWVRLWQVCAFALAIGLVNAIETPTRMAFVSELVGPALLPNASALSAAYFNIARVVGPAAAGPLIAAFGTGPAMAINAGSYLATVAGLRLMRPAEIHRHARPAVAPRIVDGLRYVLGRADLVVVLGLVAAVGLFGMHRAAAGAHRLPRRRDLLRAAHHRARRRFAGRRAAHDRPPQPPAGQAGDRLGVRVRRAGGGGGRRADLPGGDRPAGADRLRDPLLRPGGQPPHPARQRPELPGPGDGSVQPHPAGDDAAGQPGSRLARRAPQRPRRLLRRRPRLRRRRGRRLGGEPQVGPRAHRVACRRVASYRVACRSAAFGPVAFRRGPGRRAETHRP